MNVYMKHAGSSYFSFEVCFIVPVIAKCSTANKNTAESSSKSSAFCYCFLKIGPKLFHFSLYSIETQFDRFLLAIGVLFVLLELLFISSIDFVGSLTAEG